MRPLEELEILPGLSTVQTDRGSKGRWKDGDKVRFHKGMPQKLGGWVKAEEDGFLGVCRALLDWQSLASEKLMALGTNQRLYVYTGGAFSNITPYSSTGTFANNPITTVNGSAVVTIAHIAHGRNQGDYVDISGASAVGGITISGEYSVTAVVNSDSYTITHSAPATSAATGGGAAVSYSYELGIGQESSTYGTGWGSGSWSELTWGTPRTVSSFLSSARIWSLDTWGEDLVGCPRGGGIYLWDTSVGVSSRAAVIAGAPETAKAVFVSPENQHLVALGAHSGVSSDPLLIRWSSSENYGDWTPSSINSAGAKRLNTGNEIMCGVKANKEILIFTDSHLWTMVFVGPPNVFAFGVAGQNGGIRGQNAAREYNGVVYWMSEKDFYYYDGAPKELPCDVWPTVFDNINFVQRGKTFAGVNRQYGEIWWFYCSAGSSEVDRYVTYNVDERAWSFGTMARTAYVGDSSIESVPYGTSPDGYLYDHETGVDADGAAMEATLESYDIEIGNGEMLAHVGMMVPDFKVLTGSISLSLSAKKYPHSQSPSSSTTVTITQDTEYINPRIKGRQVSMSFRSSALGDDWRFGTMRAGVRGHGKK